MSRIVEFRSTNKGILQTIKVKSKVELSERVNLTSSMS